MDYKNINDYEQLYLVCENDEESRNILFQKYQPIIVSISKKYYEFYKDRGICFEDLVQEGNIGFMNAIKNFRETENTLFYTFSTVCVERQVASYCRRYMADKNKSLNEAFSIEALLDKNNNYSNLFIDNINSYRNPDVYLNNNDIYEHLIVFKNSLPIIQSLIFELRYNGFKYKEIAKLLDISVNCVDSNLHCCKIKFKKEFGI